MSSKEFINAAGIPYALVMVDVDKKLISDKWSGAFETQENFRTVLEYICLQIKTHQLTLWFADLRGMEGDFEESSEWLSSELMPAAIQAGLKREAIVLPKNVFARISTKDTIQKIQSFELQQFHNYKEAEKWLIEGTQIKKTDS